MKILFTIAWRNIWRNKKRTWILGAAINFGILAMVFMSGYMDGFIKAFLNSALDKQYSHIQIHHPKFEEFFQLKYGVNNIDEVEDVLIENNYNYSTRTLANGLLSSSKKASSTPIMVFGIDPEMEEGITNPGSYLTEGKFLEGRRNPAYVSEALAKQLKLKLRSKIQLNFSDINGDRVSAVFKVAGFYDMKHVMLDKSRIYVRQSDLNRLIGKEEYANEVALLVNDFTDLTTDTTLLKGSFPDLKVQSWQEIAPELAIMDTSAMINSVVFKGIILFALIFGIVNTLMMSVLERTKELGVFNAIGMNRKKMFLMIVLEAIILSVVTTPIGLLLSILMIEYFGTYGLDLSFLSESLETWGIDSIIYMEVSIREYFNITVGLAVTGVISSIYPAIKTFKLKPAEAIRK